MPPTMRSDNFEQYKYRSHCRARRLLLGLMFLQSLLILTDGDALGASIQPPLAIKETARIFIDQQIGRDFPKHETLIGNLDPRLKLTACDKPLEGFLPPGGRLPGNTTIGIRCAGGKPWTIYVPVAVTATRKIAITNRPILRGATITKDDIVLEYREVAANGSYISDPEHVLGKIAKRSLPAAAALEADMLSAPLLVRRGQQVIILAEDSGLAVRMAGTSLMDGAEGQLIHVQNSISKRTVEGLVIQPGIVRVNM